MGRYWFVLALGLSCACESGSSSESGSPAKMDWTKYRGLTPYAGLTDVEWGKIRCQADSCCYRQCDGNQDLVCLTRDPLVILGAFATPPDSCTAFVFPEWFYAGDCFVPTAGIRGGASGHPDAGKPLNFVALTLSEVDVQCFCGRTGDGYAAYGYDTIALEDRGCGEPHGPDAYTSGHGLFDCTSTCTACTPHCTNRECGSDLCQGNCGSCTAPDVCSAGGQCVSSGGGSTCSECLSTCKGLPGCCTGCGCLCEDECGGCF